MASAYCRQALSWARSFYINILQDTQARRLDDSTCSCGRPAPEYLTLCYFVLDFGVSQNVAPAS